jgi:hypothetical protein
MVIYILFEDHILIYSQLYEQFLYIKLRHLEIHARLFSFP